MKETVKRIRERNGFLCVEAIGKLRGGVQFESDLRMLLCLAQ